jgi:hypothetical protein
MIEPIDAIRSIRADAHPFERVMSGLTVAIGDVERLTSLEPDQIARLCLAVARLGNAVAEKAGD